MAREDAQLLSAKVTRPATYTSINSEPRLGAYKLVDREKDEW